MDEELKGIIQRMIDAGEPEENIGKVIQSYKAQGLSEVKKKRRNRGFGYKSKTHNYYFGYRCSKTASAFGYFKFRRADI
jgi:hypothetical protein